MKKKKQKNGVEWTEAGAKWNSIFLCNGWIMFIKTTTGKKEIPFSFRSAVFNLLYEV